MTKLDTGIARGADTIDGAWGVVNPQAGYAVQFSFPEVGDTGTLTEQKIDTFMRSLDASIAPNLVAAGLAYLGAQLEVAIG